MASGEISGGTIAAFIITSALVAGAFGALTETYGDLLRGAGAASRLSELLTARPDIAAPARPQALPEPPRGALSSRSRRGGLSPDTPVEKIRRAIEQASVVNTVANLMTFDWVVERVKSGELAVHGWYFDMTAAQLYAFNPQTCVFDKVDIGDVPEAAVSALDCTPESVRQRLSKFADVAKAGF